MNDRCDAFDRRLEAGGAAAGDRESWADHLAGCADCREQDRADALLRGALAAPAPELAAGFDGRLLLRLEARAARRSAGGLGRSAWWLLAGYGTAAAAVSVVILARLPWQSLTPSPALGITLGALALLSPLVLLDRVGVVRPPG